MKLLLSITFCLLIAAVLYLAVDKRSPGAPEPQPSSSEATSNLELKTSNSSRSEIPHLVKTLIDPTKHLEEQIEAVRALPADLTTSEFEALIDLLYQDPPETLSPELWSTIQNEVMEVLRRPRFALDQYPQAMAKLLTDRSASPIMRDYAAQHLALMLRERSEELPKELRSDSVSSLISILSTNTRDSSHQVTGTTLMALCNLNKKKPALLKDHRQELNRAVLSMLADSTEVTFSNRIAAIQAAGRLNVAEALPKIREMAMKPQSKQSYRLSSIAALGYYADPKDRPALEALAKGQTKLRFAAQSALKNFR